MLLKYILNRLLMLIPTLLLVSGFVFLLLHLIPGDPIDYIMASDDSIDASMREVLEKEMGLDKPLHLQYLGWMGDILRGDFGESIHYQQSNIKIILERFPPTILLTLGATLVSVLIAIPAGVLAAIKRNTVADYSAMSFALLGMSIPNFWLGIMLILTFALFFPILPASGYVFSWSDPLKTLWYLVLPSVTLGTGMAAIVARMTRSEMLEELGKEYVRTARAKGVPERTVIFKHTLRNALNPVITVIGIQFGNLLGGTVVVEYVFAYPGVGSLVVDAVYSRDYPLVQALILIFALIFVGVNFIVDILYKYSNPRITLE